jgi:hypothetical protein
VKKNSRMEALCHDIKSRGLKDPKQLSRKLVELLDAGFTRADGCVLQAALEKLRGNANIDDFPDRTGYECFVNHIHVEDYFDEDGSFGQIARLGQGIAFANDLKERLSSFSADENFRLIVSSDESSCSVRFHVIRNGEEWLSPDLNSYQQEAILVLDTGTPGSV